MEENRLEKAREYEAKYGSRITEEERPVFHVTPTVGWLNDPNGFSYYNGQYHLFYQYNPYSTHWDSMHWGHLVSEDMLNWKRLPAALAPDTWYDNFGVFSGSALTAPDGRHLLIYTGKDILPSDAVPGFWRRHELCQIREQSGHDAGYAAGRIQRGRFPRSQDLV